MLVSIVGETIPVRSSQDSKHNLIVRNARPRRRRAPRSGAFQTAVVLKSAVWKPPLLEKRKLVAVTKCAALKSAKVSAQIGRATAKNNRYIDPARNREPGAAPAIRRPHRQVIIFRHESRVTGGEIFVADAYFECAATPGDESLVVKAQPDRPKRQFEPGRIFTVAD